MEDSMTNRLRAYVRRTILSAAREYAGNKRDKASREEGLRAALIDATSGTNSGWWSDLIYIAPMLEMAHRYRHDIAAALDAYRHEVGKPYVYVDRQTGKHITEGEITCALLHGPYTMSDYNHSPEPDAALIGLRFAVEWYAGEIARELSS
jgi:hypothetical protein